jgi:hypothetical protein
MPLSPNQVRTPANSVTSRSEYRICVCIRNGRGKVDHQIFMQNTADILIEAGV